jgi:hypothetical protein
VFIYQKYQNSNVSQPMLSFVGENVPAIHNRYIQKKHHPWGSNKLTTLSRQHQGKMLNTPLASFQPLRGIIYPFRILPTQNNYRALNRLKMACLLYSVCSTLNQTSASASG